MNPDASYLDIEKSYYKNKGKLIEVEEVPFDASKKGKSSSSLENLGLVRPVPIKGTKFKSDEKVAAPQVKKPNKPASKESNITKSSVPKVILRKPTVYNEDSDDTISSRLRIKPNLSLTMRNGQVKEKFSDMTLLRKPEPSIAKDTDQNQETSNHLSAQMTNDKELMTKEEATSNLTLLERPDKAAGIKGDDEFGDAKVMDQAAGKTEDEEFGDAKVTVPNDVGIDIYCNIEVTNEKDSEKNVHVWLFRN